MLFSDLIFVFAFLPIYTAITLCCREAWAKNAVSVIGALVLITWGRQWYYALIILPVFLIYICGFFANKIRRTVLEAVGDISAVCFCAFAIIGLGGGSLKNAVWAVGLIFFAMRCVHYNKEVSSGEEPERDFFALAAYLVSLENILISPLGSYFDSRERLRKRKQSLSKLSYGLSAFIRGFALVAVSGLAAERIRLAAHEYAAFPWLNAVISVAITFVEAYIVAAGVLGMSRGLGLMGGLSPKNSIPAFLPRARVGEHLEEFWESLPKFASECFYERSAAGRAVSLAAISLLSGVFLSFGCGAGAFFGMIILAIVLENMSEKKSRAADIAFSAVMMILAFLALSGGSVGGIAEIFGAFNIRKYDYDITYALYTELLRGLPWVVIGAAAVSPLGRFIAAKIRPMTAENEKTYGTFRIVGTALSAILLLIATVASAASV